MGWWSFEDPPLDPKAQLELENGARQAHRLTVLAAGAAALPPTERYILSLDGNRYWFSGDGDPNPDIEQVKADVALICIGGDPYVMNATEAAGVVKKIKPQLAVPNHYGFVVGVDSDGEKFAREAAPVKVQLLKPVNAFEKTGAAAH